MSPTIRLPARGEGLWVPPAAAPTPPPGSRDPVLDDLQVALDLAGAYAGATRELAAAGGGFERGRAREALARRAETLPAPARAAFEARMPDLLARAERRDARRRLGQLSAEAAELARADPDPGERRRWTRFGEGVIESQRIAGLIGDEEAARRRAELRAAITASADAPGAPAASSGGHAGVAPDAVASSWRDPLVADIDAGVPAQREDELRSVPPGLRDHTFDVLQAMGASKNLAQRYSRELTSGVAGFLGPFHAAEQLGKHVSGRYPTDEAGPTGSALEVVASAMALPPAVRKGVRAATDSLASRSAGLYNPPIGTRRPFGADYPSGAKTDERGNLTHSIDGDPLEVGGRIVGRRVAGGADEALAPQEFDAITEAVLGRGPELLPAHDMGRNLGAVHVHRYSRQPTRLTLRRDLTPESLPKVYAHEVGHVIDQAAGEIPTKSLSRELAHIYHVGNTQRQRPGSDLPATWGKPRRPQDQGYSVKEIPREHMAEAIRLYMADPAWMKENAPKTAAAIRVAVNRNSALRRIIQFNSLAATAGLATHGAGDPGGAPEDLPGR